MGDVRREVRFVGRRGMANIDGHDQDRYAALAQRRLGGHGRFTPRLRRRADFLAKNTAALVDGLEIDFLRKIEADLIAGNLAGDQDDRRAVAVRLKQAVYKMQATRPTRSGTGREVAGD